MLTQASGCGGDTCYRLMHRYTRLGVRTKSPLQLQCSPVGDNSDPCCVSVHCITVSYVHAHNTGQQKNKDILKSGKDKETQGNFDGTKSSLIFATIEEKA